MPIIKPSNHRLQDPENVQARKNQIDPWIMYLIVRETLNMGVGKIAAQTGHAVGIIYEDYESLDKELDFLSFGDQIPEEKKRLKFVDDKCYRFTSWKGKSFRKIVLKADDKEWEKLKRQLECYLVVDAGLTEVEAGSETVIALWPMLKSLAPPIIKRLRLL